MQYILNVTGMSCGHCEQTVTRSVQGVDPQAQLRIDRALNTVYVETTQPISAVVSALEQAGYPTQQKN